ncbi:TPA: hypothetical protein HA231_00040, partial [Candidatus Woesearchaeota archaeon]|nr:hypothetical protein [Candidatus Woesearchaeota archaeon]
MKKLGLFLVLLAAVGMVSASLLGNLSGAMSNLCTELELLLPVVAMLMVIVA